MSDVEIRSIDWNTILDVWQHHLWVGRSSPIEPTSAMTLNRQYDMSYMDTNPVFWGAYIDGELVGVNSGHSAGLNQFRSRGLFVFPEHRGKMIGQLLIQAVVDYARSAGCELVWTIPRKGSFGTYQRVGFKQISDWFTDSVEFGPNCYAVYELKE